jgi:hypothetical protein
MTYLTAFLDLSFNWTGRGMAISLWQNGDLSTHVDRSELKALPFEPVEQK